MNSSGLSKSVNGQSASSRNTTGVYAGMDPDKMRQPFSSPAIPPLSHSRGRIFLRKTPTEQSRQVRIENIREQKTYRGFSGSKVKMLQRTKSGSQFVVTANLKQQWPPQPPSWEELHRLSKTSYLGRSAAASEDGRAGRLSSSATTAPASVELLTRELERAGVHEQLVGLHDCYRRICKGSTRSLFALLVGSQQRHTTTGLTAAYAASATAGSSCPSFSVRGYGAGNSNGGGGEGRVLTSAPRPSTAGSGRSLLVPQPLFFKRFIEPYKMMPSQAGKKSSQESAGDTERALAIPSPQVLLQENEEMRKSKQSLSPPQYLMVGGGSSVTHLSAEAAISPRSPAGGDDESGEHDARPRDSSLLSLSRQSSPSRSEIDINVETDDGDAALPEIDDVDEDVKGGEEPIEEHVLPTNLNIRRQSITERLQKLRLGEFVANAIKEEAEERKRVLKDLMTEHEYLVKIVNTGSVMLQ